uniref:SWIM-type domain-containing protein n=1 Tax=Tanacetum cinerariifolium TaxID=118510 RepID=A0A6L2P1R1_TANCI|nr:hypothetical protein [Tanacetum cinerariifolium]
MQKSANWRVHGILHSKIYEVDDRRRVHRLDLNTRSCSCRKWKLSGIPCGHVIAVARVMGCTDCSELVLDRIKSQGEELIQVRCSRCSVHGHTRASCHEPILNYGKSQVEEYEGAYNNNNWRSQEYAADYNNNNKRSQEYEYKAAYNNNNGRSQDYAGANNNNYRRTQEYEYKEAYNNNNEMSQEYVKAYNNSYERSQEYAGAYFNEMYDQPNNIGFAFNFSQSSQQTISTWNHVNLDDP